MFSLCIFAFIIHGVLSSTPFQDGVKIITKEMENLEDIIGNWTYIYHWDPRVEFDVEFLEGADDPLTCPQLTFKPVTPELIKAKKDECAKEKIPFDWADAKLRIDSHALKIDAGVIIVGKKENWMVVECNTMVRVVVKKVTDSVIAMINPDQKSEELLVRGELPKKEEVECIAHNVDIGKGLKGFGVCYMK